MQIGREITPLQTKLLLVTEMLESAVIWVTGPWNRGGVAAPAGPRQPGSEASRGSRRVWMAWFSPMPLLLSPHVHRELRTPSGASAPSPSWMPGSSRKGKSRGGGEPTVHSPSGGFTWKRRSKRSEYGVWLLRNGVIPFSSGSQSQ